VARHGQDRDEDQRRPSKGETEGAAAVARIEAAIARTPQEAPEEPEAEGQHRHEMSDLDQHREPRERPRRHDRPHDPALTHRSPLEREPSSRVTVVAVVIPFNRRSLPFAFAFAPCLVSSFNRKLLPFAFAFASAFNREPSSLVLVVTAAAQGVRPSGSPERVARAQRGGGGSGQRGGRERFGEQRRRRVREEGRAAEQGAEREGDREGETRLDGERDEREDGQAAGQRVDQAGREDPRPGAQVALGVPGLRQVESAPLGGAPREIEGDGGERRAEAVLRVAAAVGARDRARDGAAVRRRGHRDLAALDDRLGDLEGEHVVPEGEHAARRRGVERREGGGEERGGQPLPAGHGSPAMLPRGGCRTRPGVKEFIPDWTGRRSRLVPPI